MSAELAFLKKRVVELSDVYSRCDTRTLSKGQRLLTQPWLSEVGLQVERLQRDIVQLDAEKPSPVGLRQAWSHYWQVFTALSPVAQPAHADAQAGEDPVLGGLRLVARRLSIVFRFLVAQLTLGVVLIVLAVRLFTGFDPQTALTGQQWSARAPARAQIERVRVDLDEAQRQFGVANTASAVPSAGSAQGAGSTAAVPDVTVLRAEVESLAASLPELGMATTDLRTANVWIDSALVDLDKDPPAYGDGSAALRQLEALLTGDAEKAPPSIIAITILGSLLGMITITIHLNWKFRNRWDTVGFLPWYITKLIAAPVISLCAIGLLSQLTFTRDLSTATGLTNLGLVGASPMLTFSVAILTGLFSNRVFDWLRSLAESTTSTAGIRPGTGAGSTNPTSETITDAD